MVDPAVQGAKTSFIVRFIVLSMGFGAGADGIDGGGFGVEVCSNGRSCFGLAVMLASGLSRTVFAVENGSGLSVDSCASS